MTRSQLQRGQVDITPRTAEAGQAARYVYVYTAGPAGIATGGGFEIARHNQPQMSEVQAADPHRAGFVTATTSGHARLELETGLRSTFTWYARATVRDAALEPGETIAMTWGAPPGPGAIQQTTAGERIMWDCAVDAAGTGEWRRLDGVPALRVTGGPPSALRVTAPSTATVSEAIVLRVAALDRWLNAARQYAGRITLGCSDPQAALPAEWRCEPGQSATAAFVVRLGTPGVHRVWVRDEAAALAAESNPIVVTAAPPPARVYWGDLHAHSYGCDGIGWPDELFRYSRDVSHLDFAAITSHDMVDVEDWTFDDMRAAVQRWREAPRAADTASPPFVPFAGYEWRNSAPRGGHLCVVFREPAEAIFLRGADVRQAATPAALWEQLGAREALTIPHHTAAGHDWTHHAAHFVPLLEIYSDWGSSEFAGNPWWAQRNAAQGTSVQDALVRGYRLGVIGSGDDHTGLPGRTGLAAVWAEAATSDALWEALHARRTYATTGARILLRFDADGHPMGRAYTLVDASAAPVFGINIEGTAPLDRVDLVREGITITSWPGDGSSHFDVRWTDDDDRPLARGPGGAVTQERWYYVRVRQRDGHLAWSSPIWVRTPGVEMPVGAGAGQSARSSLAADRPHQLARASDRKWAWLPGAGPAVCVWRQAWTDGRGKLFVSIGGDDAAYAFAVHLELRGWVAYQVVTHRLGGDLLETSDHFWDKHPLGTLHRWQLPRRAPSERPPASVEDDGAGSIWLRAGTEPRERACLEVVVEPATEPDGELCHALLAATVDGEAHAGAVWLGDTSVEATPDAPLRIDLRVERPHGHELRR